MIQLKNFVTKKDVHSKAYRTNGHIVPWDSQELSIRGEFCVCIYRCADGEEKNANKRIKFRTDVPLWRGRVLALGS